MSTNRITVIAESDFDTLATFTPVMVTTAAMRPGMILIDEDGIACEVLNARIGSGPRGSVRWATEDVDSNRVFDRSFSASLTPTVRVASVRFAA